MSYGIKYIANFVSEVLQYDFEIKILQRDYAGEIYYRNLGSAPVLRKDRNGTIAGTSLELSLEAAFDGDLREFYVEDNRKFKVEVYRDEVLYWVGFVVIEQYKEPMIAYPYDVTITATDGLGLLKNEIYNRNSSWKVDKIRGLLTEILAKTQLSLDLQIESNLWYNCDGIIKNDFWTGSINNGPMDGKNAYDILEILLNNFGCSITQDAGKWLITRAGSKEGDKINSVVLIDTVDNASACFPVGQLEMEMVPPQKSIEVNFIQDTDYIIGGKDISDFSGLFGNDSHKFKQVVLDSVNCIFFPGIDTVRYEFMSSSKINIESTKSDVQFEIEYALYVDQVTDEDQYSLAVWILNTRTTETKLKSSGLGGKGWGPSQEMLVLNADQLSSAENGIKWNTFTLMASGFPYTGWLEVRLYGAAGKRNTSTEAGVYIKRVGIKNILNQVSNIAHLNENVGDEEKIDIYYGDKYEDGNMSEYCTSSIIFNNRDVFNWGNRNGDVKYSFLDCLIEFYANLKYKARRNLSGVLLSNKKCDWGIATFFHYQYDNKYYYIDNGDYNLLTDELNVTLLEAVDIKSSSWNIEKIEGVRTSDENKQVARSSGENEVRVYQQGNISIDTRTAKMIRDLDSVGEITEDSLFEIDNGISSNSFKAPFLKIIDYLKTVFAVVSPEMNDGKAIVWDDVLKLIKTVDKVPDSVLWNGETFSAWLNQAVRTTDEVQFKKVRALEFIEQVEDLSASSRSAVLSGEAVCDLLTEEGSEVAATTLGELTNVDAAVDTAKDGCFLVKENDIYAAKFPTKFEINNLGDLLIPAYDIKRNTWIFISGDRFGTNIPPVTQGFPYVLPLTLS